MIQMEKFEHDWDFWLKVEIDSLIVLLVVGKNIIFNILGGWRPLKIILSIQT